ncbi:MAG: hypothetical protein H6586_09195 [Flavobacteriales bacterium]|nr:hypothetical protein [Flavobacteriales bacterium]
MLGIVFAVSLITIHFYWIGNLVYSFFDFHKHTISNEGFTSNIQIINATQNIFSVFNLSGYLDRNMYYYVFANWILIFFIASIFLFCISVIIILLNRNQLDKRYYFWTSLILGLFLIAKCANPPFGKFTLWLYDNFVLMKAFRSPQHLMFLPAFILPIILSFNIRFLTNQYPKNKNIITILFFLIVFLWISGWWYTGDLGHSVLMKQKKDHIDLYGLSPGFTKAIKKNQVNSLYHRILFLPSVKSPYYLPNEYQNHSQGEIAEYLYLKNPTLTIESNPFVSSLDEFFCSKSKSHFNYTNYISLFNLRYIYFRKDIVPAHTSCYTNGDWDWDIVKAGRKIDELYGSDNIFREEYGSFYLYKDFVPLIHTSNNLLINNTTLEEMVSLPTYKIGSIMVSENDYKNIKCCDYSSPIIEYKKINPTKYRVRIHGVRGAFPLLLSEKFSPKWKIYITNNLLLKKEDLPSNVHGTYKVEENNIENQASQEELFDFINNGWITTLNNSDIQFVSKKFHNTVQNDNLLNGIFYETFEIMNNIFGSNIKLLEQEKAQHYIANDYANLWILDTENLCSSNFSKNGFCVKNADGSYSYELIIEYYGQKIFYIGLLIGIIGFLGIVIVYSILWIRRK